MKLNEQANQSMKFVGDNNQDIDIKNKFERKVQNLMYEMRQLKKAHIDQIYEYKTIISNDQLYIKQLTDMEYKILDKLSGKSEDAQAMNLGNIHFNFTHYEIYNKQIN